MSSPLVNQVNPNGAAPYVNSWTFGQLIGQVLSWNPSVDSAVIETIINDAVRSYYDRRLWLGLMRKGQILSPGYTTSGQVTLVRGSTTVSGTNTGWQTIQNGQPLVGQQFRLNFTSPIYTIVGASLATNPQTITLEMPWGLPSTANTGYIITQFYYVIPGAKYIFSCKNLQMCYRMWTNVTQALLENWDPSRLQYMYPRVLAAMPTDASGNYQVELWPAPNTSQAFPILFYTQPPNLTSDGDSLPAYIRGDIVKCKAIADALLYRPKNNPNYSEQTCVTIAQQKLKEYEAELNHAASNDENLYRNDIITQWEMMPMARIDGQTGMLSGGATLAAMSAFSADDY